DRVQANDVALADAIKGTLELLVDAADMAEREPVTVDLSDNEFGMGRELFAPFRRVVGPSDQGASVLFHH
ncbi:phosphogluconate dehydratase, partial [Rhizobium ruizarguesonis]